MIFKIMLGEKTLYLFSLQMKCGTWVKALPFKFNLKTRTLSKPSSAHMALFLCNLIFFNLTMLSVILQLFDLLLAETETREELQKSTVRIIVQGFHCCVYIAFFLNQLNCFWYRDTMIAFVNQFLQLVRNIFILPLPYQKCDMDSQGTFISFHVTNRPGQFGQN